MTTAARVFVLALVGAEGSGKTQLAAILAGRLAACGQAVQRVGDMRREFRDRHGRRPRIDEQAVIAAGQSCRIETACRTTLEAAGPAGSGVVVADTTALMTAVYSEAEYGDRSLHAIAARDHARCHFTLLASPDLPWQADDVRRTGERSRETIDSRLRAALHQAGAAYAVIGGTGEARTDAAWAALGQARAAAGGGPSPAAPSAVRWRPACDCTPHLPTFLAGPDVEPAVPMPATPAPGGRAA